VDKGAVILDVPGFITVIMSHETRKRLLPIVIVVEKIPVDTHTIGKQGGHGHAREIWEYRQVSVSDGCKRWIGQF
jgi:hypothetical protein